MKMFIAPNNSKFINNLKLVDINNLSIISEEFNGKLYKLHQQDPKGYYVFSSDSLTNEIVQFMKDYHHKVKFFLYHSTKDKELIQKLTTCSHLIHAQENEENTIVLPPNLVNTKVFNYSEQSISKNTDCFIAFADYLPNIPKDLADILYPKTKYKIKIYGSRTGLSQNLGTSTERDKAELLNRYTKYLALDNFYNQEALLAGCDIYTTSSILNNTTINSEIALDYESYDNLLIDMLT